MPYQGPRTGAIASGLGELARFHPCTPHPEGRLNGRNRGRGRADIPGGVRVTRDKEPSAARPAVSHAMEHRSGAAMGSAPAVPESS